MARIAKSDVHKALEHAANHILEAGGSDGIVSRRDIRKRLTLLQGVEQQLVDTFYRFIDHRDAGKGNRVTQSDVTEAVAYAKENLIDRYDLNQNGLSQSEIQQMSLTGKLAVALARILKRAGLLEDELSTRELAQLFTERSEGLFIDDFGSEAAEFVEGFSFPGPIQELTRESFMQVAGLDPSNPSENLARFLPADADFYERFVDRQFPDRAQQAADVLEILRANLTQIHIAIVGEDNVSLDSLHPLYVAGITKNGDVAGLKSGVVWT